ncbi:hypothetical protein Tco_1126630 [Tanacetum coccineum]
MIYCGSATKLLFALLHSPSTQLESYLQIQHVKKKNSQAKIVSEEQLVPCANRLVIKKNNQRMPPLDPNNTYIQPPSEIQILKFIKTSGYGEDPETKMIAISKMVATRLHQPWRAILGVLNRCITGKDSSWDTVRLPILQILWVIVHSANLDSASLI